ncbi:hypothetical protein A3203_38750 (plasmid) [Burkholderia cenocepacia]|nr:hypothetical protein A3203_38750 [Burkholderia cenocepacia]
MISDALKHRVQVGKRLDIVQACRADEAVDHRRALATAVGAREQIIAPAEDQRPDRALRRIVVHLDAPVFAIACECVPVPQ